MYTIPKSSVICTDATDQDAYGFFFYIYIHFVQTCMFIIVTTACASQS